MAGISGKQLTPGESCSGSGGAMPITASRRTAISKGIGCVVGDYGGSLGRRTIVRQIVSGSRGCGLKTILRVIDLYEPLRRAG